LSRSKEIMAKQTALLGVSLQTKSLRLAMLDKSTGELLALEELSMQSDPIKDSKGISALLIEWEKQQNAEVVDRAFALSRKDVVFQIVEKPAETKNIEEYISWSLSTYLSSDLNDYYYDFQEISSSDKEGAQLAIAAVRKRQMDSFYNGIRSTLVAPSVVDIDVFALINALKESDSFYYDKHHLLMIADANEITLLRMKANSLCQVWRKPHEEKDDFVSVRDSLVEILDQWSDEDFSEGPLQQKVFYTGDLVLVEEFGTLLSDISAFFQFSPLDEFAKIKLSSESMRKQLPAYSLALGAALRLRGGDK
jgi:hypothetical protein